MYTLGRSVTDYITLRDILVLPLPREMHWSKMFVHFDLKTARQVACVNFSIEKGLLQGCDLRRFLQYVSGMCNFQSVNTICLFYKNAFLVMGKVIFLLSLRIWGALGPCCWFLSGLLMTALSLF